MVERTFSSVFANASQKSLRFLRCEKVDNAVGKACMHDLEKTCFEGTNKIYSNFLSEEKVKFGTTLSLNFTATSNYHQSIQINDHHQSAPSQRWIESQNASQTSTLQHGQTVLSSLRGLHHANGWVHHSQLGRFDSAIEWHKKSLQLRIEVLGEDHIGLSYDVFVIGHIHYCQRELDLSLAVFSDYTDLQNRYLSSESSIADPSLLASIWYKMGQI